MKLPKSFSVRIHDMIVTAGILNRLSVNALENACIIFSRSITILSRTMYFGMKPCSAVLLSTLKMVC